MWVWRRLGVIGFDRRGLLMYSACYHSENVKFAYRNYMDVDRVRVSIAAYQNLSDNPRLPGDFYRVSLGSPLPFAQMMFLPR